MKRQVMLAGNWKMNNGPAATAELLINIRSMTEDSMNEVVVAPPFVSLDAASKVLAGSGVKLAAQNVEWHEKGAYTGEISIDMLKAFNVEYVIIGHSERRQYFGETDEGVNLKAKALLANGLKPIICVGEDLSQRERGVTDSFVSMQVRLALNGLIAGQMEDVVIAYEPIWAIGTGMTASSGDANETIKMIRSTVRDMFGGGADWVRILYGGSMNDANASELLGMSDIDGGLIGGASLDATKFSKIVHVIG